MPQFMVTQQPGYWDGAQLHPVGTILEISPPDYNLQLSVTFKGMDPEAEEAVKRKRGGMALNNPEFPIPSDHLPPPLERIKPTKVISAVAPEPQPVRLKG